MESKQASTQLSACGSAGHHHPTSKRRLVCQTHTHLSLLMSRCYWDMQRKSSNPPIIPWETEQNTDLLKTWQAKPVSRYVLKYFPRVYMYRCEAVQTSRVDFLSAFSFQLMHLNLNRLSTPCWLYVCEKLVGGLYLTGSGLQSRQTFRGMWEICGRR